MARRSASAKVVKLSATGLAKAKAELANVRKTPGELERQRKMLDFVDGLDAGAVKSLLDDLATKPLSGGDDYEAFNDLIARWTELDPAAALASASLET